MKFTTTATHQKLRRINSLLFATKRGTHFTNIEELIAHIQSVDIIASNRIPSLLKDIATKSLDHRQVIYYYLKSSHRSIFRLMVVNTCLKEFDRKGRAKTLVKRKIELKRQIETISLGMNIDELSEYLLPVLVIFYKQMISEKIEYSFSSSNDEVEDIDPIETHRSIIRLKRELLSKLILYFGTRKEIDIGKYNLIEQILRIRKFTQSKIINRALNIALTSPTINLELKDDIISKDLNEFSLNSILNRCKENKNETIDIELLRKFKEKLDSDKFIEVYLSVKNFLFLESNLNEMESNCYCPQDSKIKTKILEELGLTHQILFDALVKFDFSNDEAEFEFAIYELPFRKINNLIFWIKDCKRISDLKMGILKNSLKYCSYCYHKEENKEHFKESKVNNLSFYLHMENIDELRKFYTYGGQKYDLAVLDILMSNDIVDSRIFKGTYDRYPSQTIILINKYDGKLQNYNSTIDEIIPKDELISKNLLDLDINIKEIDNKLVKHEIEKTTKLEENKNLHDSKQIINKNSVKHEIEKTTKLDESKNLSNSKQLINKNLVKQEIEKTTKLDEKLDLTDNKQTIDKDTYRIIDMMKYEDKYKILAIRSNNLLFLRFKPISDPIPVNLTINNTIIKIGGAKDIYLKPMRINDINGRVNFKINRKIFSFINTFDNFLSLDNLTTENITEDRFDLLFKSYIYEVRLPTEKTKKFSLLFIDNKKFVTSLLKNILVGKIVSNGNIIIRTSNKTVFTQLNKI